MHRTERVDKSQATKSNGPAYSDAWQPSLTQQLWPRTAAPARSCALLVACACTPLHALMPGANASQTPHIVKYCKSLEGNVDEQSYKPSGNCGGIALNR